MRLLRYFLAVARELHFGRAAKTLNISQPPLSQQIIKLEQELGVPLFIRNKRMVKLTEPGKALVRHAEKILGMVENARTDISRISAGDRGTISIGYVGPAMDSFLPDIIRGFKQEYPEVELRLAQMNTCDQLSAILNGSVQAGIVRLFGQDTSGCHTRVIHREAYMLAVPSHHPLAGKAQVPLGSLRGEQIIFFSRKIQPALFNEWLRIFSLAGFTPDIVQQTSSYHSAIPLVAAGLGLAIVPRSSTLSRRKGVVFKPINGETPRLSLHLCHLKGTAHPVLANFKQYIRKTLPDVSAAGPF
ncbi:MAG: LysR family transcriptional regulator [Desulfobacter sp.]|nr:MAG: LysR family transcriptional regulator [Desulfobacter sp.]